MKTKFLGALAASLAMFGVLGAGVIGSGISSASAQSPDGFGSSEWENGSEEHHGGTTIIEDSFVVIINCGDFVPCIIFGFDGIPLDGVPMSTEAAGETTVEADVSGEGSMSSGEEVTDESDESMNDGETADVDATGDVSAGTDDDTTDATGDVSAGTDDAATDASGDVSAGTDGATDDTGMDGGSTADAGTDGTVEAEGIDAGGAEVEADATVDGDGEDADRSWTRSGRR